MARNRKRAKARQARRPGGVSDTEQGLATARIDDDAPPDPIEHASPDVELAEAQLALGREEQASDDDPATEQVVDREETDDDSATEQDVDREETDDEAVDEGGFGQAPNIPGVFPERVEVETDEDEVLPAERAAPRVAEPRRHPRNRLINFLQGSWRELQRVQWPDRRQTMQATGVVIGFVVVAGVFLGVADFLATKVMNYILTGHFK